MILDPRQSAATICHDVADIFHLHSFRKQLLGVASASLLLQHLLAQACSCSESDEIQDNARSSQPSGQFQSILTAELPWPPTGVAVRGKDVYVLEYINANGPKKKARIYESGNAPRT